MDRIDEILKFWFGGVEETIVPSETRARIWFGESHEVDREIAEKFSRDLEKAINGKCVEWEKSPRGQLALIITLDQFSRHVYCDSPKAFAEDDYALSIRVNGVEKHDDHKLSLIERVFYYFRCCILKIYIIMKFRSEVIKYYLNWPYLKHKSFMKAFLNLQITIIVLFGALGVFRNGMLFWVGSLRLKKLNI